jgi:WD40 repeat protein
LGDYQLLQEIARGGMGIVYRARQQKLDRIVAVKVLAAGDFATAGMQRRFRAEAEAAARLNHPGIVAIHDVGESDGLPWLSMDWVDGPNLAELAREHPLPALEAAAYVRAVAEAVQHAHDHGVLHRDLKPSNVLLDPETGPRVTDFGIARRVGAAELTRTGEMLGSPGYAAPEQALGGRADARTDVYGLGALLYHLLTTRPPFQGPTLDSVLLQLRDAEPVPPRRLNPSIPRDLEIICLRCLHKDPTQRYPRSCDVAEDLDRFRNGEPIVARPLSKARLALRWCRQRPSLAATLGLLCLVTIVAFFLVDRARREEAEAKRRAEGASALLEKSNAKLADALDRAELDRAEDLFRTGDSGDALSLLVRILRRNPLQSVATARLASGLWYGAFALPLPPPFFAGGKTLRLHFLRDGRTLIACTTKGVSTWDAASGRGILKFEDAGFDLDGSILSPDEQVVAAWEQAPRHRLHLFDVATGRHRMAPLEIEAPAQSLAFTHDGTAFVVSTGEHVVRVRDSRSGEIILDPIDAGHAVWDAVFSPDGALLATTADKAVQLNDSKTADRREMSPELAAEITLLRFSPDGNLLLAAASDGTMQLLSIRDLQFVGLPMRHRGRIRAAAFTRDGLRLVTSSNDHTARVWSVPSGEPITPVLRHRDAVSFAAFSPDETAVVTCASDHAARLWNARTGEPLTQPLRHVEQPLAAAFTPDGETLYTSGSDGVVLRWAVAHSSAHPVQQAITPSAELPTVRVTTDGKRKLTFNNGTAQGSLTDGESGGLVGILSHADQITDADFSPDRLLVATASKANEARVWDANSGQPISPPLRHLRTVSAVAFNPNSQQLATGSWDGTARIWNAKTGIPNTRSLAHGDHVTDVAFSPEGSRIATACRDGSLRIWDSATGQPLTEPLRHDAPLKQLWFHPDGQSITVTSDKSQQTWEVPVFATPPPDWLIDVAETISLSELPPDPAAALKLIQKYEQSRQAAQLTDKDSVYGRLAHRFLER